MLAKSTSLVCVFRSNNVSHRFGWYRSFCISVLCRLGDACACSRLL
jgi:hypothetical protein